MWFINGSVFTGEGSGPQDLAFEVVDGRFTQVVPADQVPADAAEVTDLGGATVVPGFLDVHTHPAFMSQLVDSVSLLPPAVQSMEDMISALKQSPVLGQGEDVWVEAFGYDESTWPEGRQPTRHDLDRVTTTQPMFVRRCDAHSAVTNTKGLQVAGITKDTPDPAPAQYGREADGSPDGRLIEVAATNSVGDLVPNVSTQERVDRVARLAQHFAERGIVGVGDMLATMIPEPLAVFREAAERGPFPQVGLYLGWDEIKKNPPVLTDEDRTGRVRVAGVKLFMDGAYSNRTAWNHDAYPGSCNHGLRAATDEEMVAAAQWARANKVQVAVHAMGDAALDHVIGYFEDQEGWMGDLPSVRLDHATLFSKERIKRVDDARMHFAVVSHTIFFFAEYGAYENNLTPEQFAIAYPIRDFYDGIDATALSSDTPATSWADADDVLVSLKAAVVRRAHNGADIGQPQAVTVPEGLELYTGRAARCMDLPGLGRIAPGYEGSFVVLSEDVFTVEPERIDQVRVAQTWMAGEQVFSA